MTSVGAVVPLYDHGAMFTMEEVKEYMMTGYNLGPRLLADPGTPPLGYFTCDVVVLGTDHMGVRRRLTRHFGNSNLDPEDIRTLSVLEVVEGSADGRVEDVWDTLQALEDSCLDGVTNIGFVEVTVRTESSSPRAVSGV